MDASPEQLYTDFLRQLASPIGDEPEVLAETFRQLERMHGLGQIEDWQMQNASEAYAKTGGKVANAARWAMDQAKDTLHSAADHAKVRANAALATYTAADPVRAMLIAAATGAVLMSLASMVARSGVRTVRRKLHR